MGAGSDTLRRTCFVAGIASLYTTLVHGLSHFARNAMDTHASLNALVGEAVAPRPIGTGGSVRVVSAFLVRAADDAVGDHGRAGSVSLEECQNLLANGWVVAHV